MCVDMACYYGVLIWYIERSALDMCSRDREGQRKGGAMLTFKERAPARGRAQLWHIINHHA